MATLLLTVFEVHFMPILFSIICHSTLLDISILLLCSVCYITILQVPIQFNQQGFIKKKTFQRPQS